MEDAMHLNKIKITDLDQAKEIMALHYRHFIEMNQSANQLLRELPPGEKEAYKRLLAELMGTISIYVLDPLRDQHPELDDRGH